MGIETATYIDGLEPLNPASTDLLKQADDHLRLIKNVLKNTFPNIDGPVTKTQDEINNPASSVPVGAVLMWYGSSASVPAGFHLCDGSLANKTDGSGTIQTPDLRDRIPMGLGSTLTVLGEEAGGLVASLDGAINLNVSTGPAGAHTHGVTVQGHALTIAEMPAHSHTVGYSDAGSSGTCIENAAGTPTAYADTSSVGSGQAHSHGATVTGVGDHTHSISGSVDASGTSIDTLPPVLGLHFIMKV